ncbi:MAG: flagellar biosynthesis protein FlhB [Lachnospiraceae bacterium]|nr:flagellar biosynthesis protein FlhB [Lachnospiraceae bacterium]MBP5653448.1 flagellar biosynthesis protein FlhB [Lachnospiraceae bacterium]
MDSGKRLKMNLQFFAEEGEGGEKTEEATPKKLDDARKEGQVAKSHELVTAFSLIALFGSLKIFMTYLVEHFVDCFPLIYNSIEVYSEGVFERNFAAMYLNEAMKRVMLIALPMLAAAVVLGFTVNVFQVQWKPTAKPLQPKFSKLDPIKGFKRMFSLDKLVELLKALIKIAVVGYLAYSTFKDQIGIVSLVYSLELFPAVMLIGNIVINFGLKVSIVFLVIGVADYIYQKFKFAKDMRMTKQEIKDEYKQTEGDPKIKGQIRQKMREASQRRMMQKLPEADVVITNPTHLACAIKYDRETAEAPVLIAKGADYLAQKIKEAARENFIPIVENKPLARMLYHNVELDEEIPQELYQMTAEVLAYVYSINGKAG